jgi:ADP-ribose pyrophosphatase
MKHLLEKRLRTRRVYRGKAVDFCVDRVRLPNGKTATREYLDHPGAVGIVPFIDPKRIVMVKQYRYPVREVTLEIPAGKLTPGENPVLCARRELKEETGYSGGWMEPLLSYWPTPAFANEILHLFIARKIKPGASSPDDDEFIDRIVISLDEALKLIYRGEIKDSKTVIALLACQSLRHWPKP